MKWNILILHFYIFYKDNEKDRNTTGNGGLDLPNFHRKKSDRL